MSTEVRPVTPQPAAPGQEPTLLPSPARRLMEAIALKNYAISKGNAVDEATLKILNDAERAYQSGEDLSDYGIGIDKSIGELTTATYPTTGESLLLTQAPRLPSDTSATPFQSC